MKRRRQGRESNARTLSGTPSGTKEEAEAEDEEREDEEEEQNEEGEVGQQVEGPRAQLRPQFVASTNAFSQMATPLGRSAIAWPAPLRVTLSVLRRHNGWRPGSNCAGYLDRGHSAGAQAQVLIANVYHNVQGLCVATRSQIERELESELGPTRTSHSGKSHQNTKAKCAGRLLGVPPSTVSNTMSILRRRGVQPGRPRGRRRGAAITSNKRAIKMVLTREALALAVSGQPKTHFIRVVSRLAEAGVDVGGGWHSASFCEGVEHAANAHLAQLVGLNLARPLPGLGVRSDFQIIFDGGTIGKVFRTSRDPLLLIGLLASDPDSGLVQDRTRVRHAFALFPFGARRVALANASVHA